MISDLSFGVLDVWSRCVAFLTPWFFLRFWGIRSTAWRIIPVSKWLRTTVRKSPKDRVFPFPNGLFMACKRGWSDHHLHPLGAHSPSRDIFYPKLKAWRFKPWPFWDGENVTLYMVKWPPTGGQKGHELNHQEDLLFKTFQSDERVEKKLPWKKKPSRLQLFGEKKDPEPNTQVQPPLQT